MASTRKIDANRKNAQRSRGPRSAEGKARSARNAFRHGLAIPLFADRQLADDAERLAVYLAGGRTDPSVLDACRRFADAHINLLRVRRARMNVLEDLLASCGLSGDCLNDTTKGDRVLSKPSQLFAELHQKLLAVDRYERRGLSRRAAAIRALEVLQIMGMSSPQVLTRHSE